LVIDPPTESALNDRWQGEADGSWSDRPGIVASLLRFRMIVVAAALLGAVAGYGLAQLLPVRYQAEASLIPADPGGPSILGGGSSLSSSDRQVYLAKQVDLMTSRVVLERARELTGSTQSLRDLREALEVQASPDMASISIVATGADARSTAALANAVGTAYEQVTADRVAEEADRAIAGLEKIRRRLQAQLDASPVSPNGLPTSRQQDLRAQITDLQQREQDIIVQAQVFASGVENFEKADRPTSPSQPKLKLAAALGALLGLLGAGAWAWWAAARNRRAEGRGDPGRILGAPLLGEVPWLRSPQVRAGRPVTARPVLDPTLEDAYHFVVASLQHELAGVGGKSIAVTSVGPGDSKTSTALQIANAASQENRKILLIDADVRMRHLSELFGSAQVSAEPNGRGPTVPGGERVGAKEYIYRLVSTDSGMVLPVVPNRTDLGQPGGSYHAVDIGDAVRSIGEMFDLVLIDTPALLVSSTALGVAGQADGVVLVVSHGVSLSQLRDVRQRLAFVKTPLIGYIYVRPPRLGPRMLWGWVRRGLGRGTWVQRVAVEPEEGT
jgi:Mrp family chromosome partitioning ATPase/capsular polysaccharide biosynthesis protein